MVPQADDAEGLAWKARHSMTLILTGTDDAALVRRCRDGDQDAWNELVRRFSPYVHAIAVQAYRLRPADAEEVFQEVFARTYERLDTLRDDAAIRPWLGQLTRRLAVDRLRAGAREHVGVEELEVAGTDPILDRLDEAIAVRDALWTLPEPSREILDRFFCRDESYATIAAALDLPPGTVASRISRALARLRGTLSA